MMLKRHSATVPRLGGLLALLACCMSLLLVSAAGAAASEGGQAEGLPAEMIFDRHRLWEAHIRISPEAWAWMQPEQNRPQSGRGMVGNMLRRLGAAWPATQPANGDYERRPPTYYGMEYTYVRGTFEFGGTVHQDVGIRFKGASSYTTMRQSLKRPLKIDFNRFVKGQRFHGLQQINLHNNACDPSQIREALSYWAFREAGIASPRTTFVLLYLTVEGEIDRACLGVYTLVEEVDKRFLASRFGTKEGLLVKPETGRLPYHGDDWLLYRRGYQPRTDEGDEETAQMIELARIIHREQGDAFREKIEQAMDVDLFLRYVLVNALTANLDSIFAIDHNFYLFAPPDGRKMIWIPWDLNLTWGGYQRLGGWDELMELSLQKPWADNRPLLNKTLAVPEWREAYMEHARRLTGTQLSLERVLAEIDAMELAVRDADCRAGGAISGGNPPDVVWTPTWRPMASPAEFARGRWASLHEQLATPAGAASAYVPRFRTGGLRGRSRPLHPARADLADATFAAIDADGDGVLDHAELTRAATRFLFASAHGGERETVSQADIARAIEPFKQAEQSNPPRTERNERRPTRQTEVDIRAQLMQRRRAEAAQDTDAPVETPLPPITLPANASANLVRSILYEADRNLDGSISRRELNATVARLLHEADANDDGRLDPAEVRTALGHFVPGR